VKTIIVANPKGGAGKTTLATNLAVALSIRGERVLLGDLDRQRSAHQWLGVRPEHLPHIHRFGDKSSRGGGERNHDWLVLDTPAALHGKNLAHAVKLADSILIPVQPSLFDMAATGDFIASLLEQRPIKHGNVDIGIVGMRVDSRTRAAATLEAFLTQFGLPVLAYLRDTQGYANAAFGGMGIFDLAPHAVSRDIEQWLSIISWVTR
jgi:chromosome partitioning protein